MKRFLILFILCWMLFSLFGCGMKIQYITDISKYASMTRETDKIEVEKDNYNGGSFTFTIQDPDEIAEVMEIILTTPLKNMGKGPHAGENTYLSVFQGENVYRLSWHVNKAGNVNYAFSTDALKEKITALAREAGAFDTENNATTDSQ